jgi:hypothetical protein
MLKLILNKLIWLLISVKMFCLVTTIILLMSGYLNSVGFTKIWINIISVRELMKEKNLMTFLRLFKKGKK